MKIGPETGVGAPCPSCPAWFAAVDATWRDHIAAEHPETFRRLRRCSSAAAEAARRERVATRKAIAREIEAA